MSSRRYSFFKISRRATTEGAETGMDEAGNRWTAEPARLLEAVREIAEGGAAMSPEVAIRVMHLFRDTQTPSQASVGLSPQELRLLKLLTEGHQNKTAAAELGISVHTVSFHLRSIYEKLHVHSRSEAVARALRDGLIQ